MKDRIAFIHIPKTAGTFFTEILKTAYNGNEICPKIRTEEFSDFYENPLLEYQLYKGHMGFSHTQKLNAKRIVFLRNPVDRLISLYFYFRDLFNLKHIKPEIYYKLAFENNLTSFFQIQEDSVISHSYNAQAWQLAFDTNIETRNKFQAKLSDNDLYKQAVKNLNECNFVGITELMDSSLECFYKLFPQYESVKNQFSQKKINVTQKRLELTDISMTDKRILMKYCDIDYAIYDYALQFFEKQIKVKNYHCFYDCTKKISEEAEKLKVLIVGGCNSVIQDGWLEPLYKQESIDIINLSMGVSCSIAGVARLLMNKDLIKGADYLLVEYGINDQAYSLSKKFLQEDSIEIYLSNIIEIALSNNIKPIVVIFPTLECYTVETDNRKAVRDLYKKICRKYAVAYIDFVDYVEEEINHKTIKDVYIDPWHYTKSYTDEFGKIILNVLKNLSLENNAKGLTVLPNFSKNTVSDNNLKNNYLIEDFHITRSSCLKQKINYFALSDYLPNEKFYKIESFNSYVYELQKEICITLYSKGNASIYGVLANFKNGGAMIKFESNNTEIIKNMYDYWGSQDESHVAIKNFLHPLSFSNSISFFIVADNFSTQISEETLFQFNPTGSEKLGVIGFLIEGEIESISVTNTKR